MIRNLFPAILMTILVGLSNQLIAQTSAGAESLAIKAGTEMSFDGFLMIPGQDLELKDNTLTKTDVAIKWPVFNSINTVYNFKSPLSFVGEFGILTDNTALNGNSKANLKIAFSALTSSNYNDFSILNSSIVNGEQVLNRLTTPFRLGSVTAVTRASVLTELVKPENFFTPNADGINDKWVIQDIQLYPGNVVTVFDRAGRTVFQMTDYNNSWDGQFNGNPLIKGTYYYTISLSKNIPPVKGFITIVR